MSAPAPAAAAPSAASKAEQLRALQQKLAALEKAKQGATTATPSVASTRAVKSVAPTPAPAAAAASAAPQTELERMRALLAAKLAAKNGTAVPPSSSLSASAAPFVPGSAASAAASSSIVAASSTAARAVPSPAAAAAARPASKPQLCRSWLTCPFGERCRFRHPFGLNTEAFFDYGGRVLLHLNAAALVDAWMAGTEPSKMVKANATMPPVLLLVVTLLTQARTDTTTPPSLPLNTLWKQLSDQLAGCRDLPATQDDLLASLGLPSIAVCLVKCTQSGAPVSSTAAFSRQYSSSFLISRAAGVFHVQHRWDEASRQNLQDMAERAEKMEEEFAKTKGRKPYGAAAAAAAASGSTAMTDDPEGEISRKRKRIPDSALAADGYPHKSSKLHGSGEVWPEEHHVSFGAGAATQGKQGHAPRGTATRTASGAYSLDAGELGGATAFVRGGIVTELSLLAPGEAARRQQQQQQRESEYDPYAHEDAFTRAIRLQGQKQVANASYTVATRKLTSGKGFDMLRRMNWNAGQGLGKREQGRVEPLEVTFRADRMGL